MMRRDEGSRRANHGGAGDQGDEHSHNPAPTPNPAPPLGNAVWGGNSLADDRFTPESLEPIWDSCPAAGQTFEESLLEAGITDAYALAEAYAQHYLLPLFDPPADEPPPIDPSIAAALPAGVCCDNLLVPLADDGLTLEVAIVSPDALRLKEQLEEETGRVIRPMFAPLSVVERLLAFLYADETRQSNQPVPAVKQVTIADDSTAQQLTGQNYLRQLLQVALRKQASEIHLEFFGDCCRVRLRVNGSLVPQAAPQLHLLQTVLTSLRNLAKLQDHPPHVPATGAFEVRYGRRGVQIELDYCPTIAGAKVTLRPHGRDQAAKPLDQLGMSADQLTELHEILQQTSGLLLLCGPARSGKRTTLYSCLAHLSTSQRTICTVEHAVRQQLPGINQTRVAPERGLGVTEAVNAMLRQQPDGFMIDCLKHGGTADACLQACRAGGLVLTAIDAWHAEEAIARIAALDPSGGSLAGHLLGIVEQRVLPRCCSHCRTPFQVSRDELMTAGFSAAWLQQHGLDQEVCEFSASSGCDTCCDQGTLGEVAIFDVVSRQRLEQIIAAKNHPTEATQPQLGLATPKSGVPRRAITASLLGQALLIAHQGIIRWHDFSSLRKTY
ncbi:GspE/PulE family protein [Planctomycetaceae bacterium SH139]